MDIIAAQFQTVGGGALSIQDLVASAEFASDGTDWIRFYDESTGAYTLVNWWGAGYGVYESAEAAEPCAASGWGDDFQTIVDMTIDPSQGFWVRSAGGGTIRAQGEVTSSGVVQVPASSMTLVANPFPVSTDIQTIVASAAFAADGTDWIRFYDESTGAYTLVNWWGAGYGVYESAEAAEPCAASGWGDDFQTIVDMTIAPGQGFWVRSAGGGTLTFQNPLTAPASAGGND